MQAGHFQKDFLAPTSPFPLGLKIERAEGCYLITEDGKRYLDLISGLAVNNVGHSNPLVLKALREQAEKYLHVIPYGEFVQRPQQAFAEALVAQLPDQLDAVYFVNSGAEGIEGALKLAKRVTGRTQLIGFDKSYHGSTHGALSVTGNETKKYRNRPLLPDTKTITFNSMEALSAISEETAAVVVEVVQGDAGVRIPEIEWVKALKQATEKMGALLIVDEVQTGFARTGKLFAHEHYDIVPDVLVLGKALGGGLPGGAFVSSSAHMKLLANDPILGHITTFGGHPLMCATGLAALKYTLDEKLAEKSKKLGEIFMDRLNHIAIKEVRGIGSMLAVELKEAKQVQQVVHGLLDQGYLGFWFLSCPEAFRLAPPLVMTEDQANQACDAILRELDKL